MNERLRVLSAGSTVRALRALGPALGPVEIATDHGHNIVVAMDRDDPPADIVLLPRDMIDALVAKGRLAAGTIALGAVATSGVVCEGAPPPDIAAMDALRAALLGASRVLLTTAPSGQHMTRVIGRLGIATEVAGKVLRFDKSSDLNAWLLRERDPRALGFGPTTEIAGVAGVTNAGLVATEAQMVLPYAAGVIPSRANEPAAQAFLKFATSREARAAFETTGMTYASASPSA